MKSFFLEFRPASQLPTNGTSTYVEFNLILCSHWTVSEHQRMCEERLAPLLCPSETLNEDDAEHLGKKDPEQEVRQVSVSQQSGSVNPTGSY